MSKMLKKKTRKKKFTLKNEEQGYFFHNDFFRLQRK